PKKKLAAVIKLQIQAGAATPAPAVGPALGQHGVQNLGVQKQYTPHTPAARGRLGGAGIYKGSGEPHVNKVGTVTMDQVREIAQTKMEDLNANDLDHATKIIAGTARSMGINVRG